MLRSIFAGFIDWKEFFKPSIGKVILTVILLFFNLAYYPGYIFWLGLIVKLVLFYFIASVILNLYNSIMSRR